MCYDGKHKIEHKGIYLCWKRFGTHHSPSCGVLGSETLFVGWNIHDLCSTQEWVIIDLPDVWCNRIATRHKCVLWTITCVERCGLREQNEEESGEAHWSDQVELRPLVLNKVNCQSPWGDNVLKRTACAAVLVFTRIYRKQNGEVSSLQKNVMISIKRLLFR